MRENIQSFLFFHFVDALLQRDRLSLFREIFIRLYCDVVARVVPLNLETKVVILCLRRLFVGLIEGGPDRVIIKHFGLEPSPGSFFLLVLWLGGLLWRFVRDKLALEHVEVFVHDRVIYL